MAKKDFTMIFLKIVFGIKELTIFALPKYTVVVAQLVRASVCGSEGRGFEPHLPPLFKLKSA